jgi:hypothetical protein
MGKRSRSSAQSPGPLSYVVGKSGSLVCQGLSDCQDVPAQQQGPVRGVDGALLLCADVSAGADQRVAMADVAVPPRVDWTMTLVICLVGPGLAL